MKQHPSDDAPPKLTAFATPSNTATGIVCAFFATVMGFALIWHIWWMVILGGLGAFATFVVFAWRDHTEDEISVAELERRERASRHAFAGEVA